MLKIDIAGVILAGGRSSRMGGRDKAFVELCGRPMIEHAIERFTPQCATLAINSNAAQGAYAAYKCPVLGDDPPDYSGPLAGVLAGLDWAASLGHTHIVTVAVDTPFFPDDLVTRLTSAAGPNGLSLAQSQGLSGENLHPTFGLWPVNLRGDLRRALSDGVRKIVAWTDRHDPGYAAFASVGHDPFFNINSPDDLQRAEDMMAVL